MKAFCFFLLAALNVSCVATFEESRTPGRLGASAPSISSVKYCRDVDDSRILWGTIAKSSAALAGASGIATIPVEDEEARIALAASALGLSAISVGAVYIHEQRGVQWVRDCSSLR